MLDTFEVSVGDETLSEGNVWVNRVEDKRVPLWVEDSDLSGTRGVENLLVDAGGEEVFIEGLADTEYSWASTTSSLGVTGRCVGVLLKKY